MSRVLVEAPRELTEGRLRRIGEGVGRVAYASRHWVVKRNRSPHEVVALVWLWRILRKLELLIPGGLGKRLVAAPGRQIRFLRVLVQAVMLIIPRSLWFTSHIRSIWWVYQKRALRGARLAEERLSSTSLIPEQIEFPPTRVKVAGWPGWLIVSRAEERAEITLHALIAKLSRQGKFDEIEVWLDRFLQLRQSGWKHGLFSLDAHLKNFGVCEERVFLIDTGGLTKSWREVEAHLSREQQHSEPHVRLGLEQALATRPDIAKRFNDRWKAIVNPEAVAGHWPD
jgi:hypothetical protein